MPISDTPAHVLEAAQKWADANSWFWKAKYTVNAYVRDVGPIRLDDGRLVEIVPDGFAFDEDAVALAMPVLVTEATVSFTGPLENIERTISIVSEEMPQLLTDMTVKRTIDKTAANRVIRDPADPAARKLLALRTVKGKLGIRKLTP